MPLVRRVPKRGFRNIFKKEYALVKVSQLSRFQPGTVVGPGLLKAEGLVPKRARRIKILADGELAAALAVKAHKISRGAKEKIEAAGGTCQELE